MGVRRLGLWCLALVGCRLDLAPTRGAVIACAHDRECPHGWTCSQVVHHCLDPDVHDLVGPGLEDLSLDPDVGRPDGFVGVFFGVDEDLYGDPAVRLDLPGGGAGEELGRAFQLIESFEHTYTFRYAVRRDEPEGTPVTVLVSLIDTAGNATVDYPVGEVSFDSRADRDADGYLSDVDCDDTRVAVHADAAEVCDGLDNDCDGLTDEDFDGDSDGVALCGGDCVDDDPLIGPGALERCNYLDDDCDGAVDEAFRDDVGRYVAEAHCGSCGVDCALAAFDHAAVGSCDPAPALPECAPVCDPGFVDADGDAEDGCECVVAPGPDTPGGGDSNCDGVDGDAASAVFVSQAGGDLEAGTPEAPVRTLARAIELAAAAGRPAVYVAEGIYREDVTLAAGVSLYGGFTDDFGLRDPSTHVAEIRGADSFVAEGPTAVTCEAINGGGLPTTVDGFTIRAGDAFAPGASSYAVYAIDCDERFVLAGNLIYAGNGASGVDGSDGAPGVHGEDGVSGSKVRAMALPSDTTPGGGGGDLACGGVDVSGGAGGTAVMPDIDEGSSSACSTTGTQTRGAGENGQGGVGPAAGTGGLAGYDSGLGHYPGCTGTGACSICELNSGSVETAGAAGTDGGNGIDGGVGAGCDSPFGELVGGRWRAMAGGVGNAGDAGGGGGGGGAGGGAEAETTCAPDRLGASGGGGGSGACGGGAGDGGQGAGGAFAVFIAFTTPPASAPAVSGNQLFGGHGGGGGDGGGGRAGGSGGDGGLGGEKDTTLFCADRAGRGGDGGAGGGGGGGGGACGGAVFGLWIAGYGALSLPDYAGENVDGGGYVAGPQGLGGSGGGAAGGGGDGLPGASGFVHE